jgi:hypothetical protein
MSDALRHEAKFFARIPVYRALSDRTGTAFLSTTLNLIKDSERELLRYGDDPSSGGIDAHYLVVSIVTYIADASKIWFKERLAILFTTI